MDRLGVVSQPDSRVVGKDLLVLACEHRAESRCIVGRHGLVVIGESEHAEDLRTALARAGAGLS